MGKQINFYMLAEDETDFLQSAESVASLSVLSYTSPKDVFEPLSRLPQKGEPGWFQLWLWSAERCQPPIVRWVPQQSHFVIDGIDSEVVEFARSHQHETSVVRGRLWGEVNARDAAAKSRSFVTWFESLIKVIKKNYRKLPTGDYVGPAADEFVRAGGSLRQMLTSPVVKIVHHY